MPSTGPNNLPFGGTPAAAAAATSSSAQRARRDLAARLRNIRLDAGLTAQELSTAAGWHKSKTSRIENARQALTDDDIRIWCRVSGTTDLAPDLIAVSRASESMYAEWRRLHLAGMRRAQQSWESAFEHTRLMRAYCSSVVPGLLQTPEYASALMSAITAFQGTPDDVTDAVTARMKRNQVLCQPGHRFATIIEESVLRYRIGSVEVMTGQLDYLLEATSLPSMTLGIIPFTVEDRPMWTLEAFTCFDDQRTYVELLAAQITITVPREVRLYLDAFDQLSALAVTGDQARVLIKAAMNATA
jgi:transcriptional regulator with XRE-family HTH domain